MGGFEPPTPASQTRCATELRYTPNYRSIKLGDKVVKEMDMVGPVIYSRDTNGIGQLILNRPEALNALNWQAMDAFAATVQGAASDDDLKALIVRGHGRAFCAGGDLFELHNFPSRSDGERLSTLMSGALDALENLACPSIAALEGPAMGGGAEIALACDLRVMGSSATLGLRHIRLAITPAWGGALRLVRLAGYSRALEWSAIGRVLSADEALSAGLATQVVPDGEALGAALEIANRIAANNRDAVSDLKRVLLAAAHGDGAPVSNLETRIFADRWASQAHLQASEKFVRSRRQRVNGREPSAQSEIGDEPQSHRDPKKSTKH